MMKKVVLVIGATSMIGTAVAKLFSGHEIKLMLVGRDHEKLCKLSASLTGETEFCVADVSVPEEIEAMISKTLKVFRRIDAIIINTAIYPWKTIEELGLAEWNQTLAVNLTAPFLLAKASYDSMKSLGSGNIIFISSIAGEQIGLPHMAAYASSKAAINGFMRTAAIEFAPSNIKVNSISPGKVFDSSIMTDAERKVKLAPVPLQRFIEPDDIAKMALFLISEAANSITGQNFIIDGGQSILGENGHLLNKQGVDEL